MASSSPHITILVGDEGVLCVPRGLADSPSPFFVAPRDAQSAAALLAIVARHPKIPLTLLADTLAQDLRREAVPRLNPFDRAKLVRRRLQQAFPQAQLTASLPVKADRSQILLAGLHGGGSVFQWLAQLTKARPANPPRIGLLAVECAGMVAKLLPQSTKDWGLLLSIQRTGGFRQIVTHQGEVIFTRLTPPLPPSARPDELCETITRDIYATRSYLSRLGLSEGAPLAAVLLIPDHFHAPLRAAGLPLQSPRMLSPHMAAHYLDLPVAPAADDPHGDLLFALWSSPRKKLRLPLTPPDLRRVLKTALIRRWGLRIAAAAFLFALGISAWDAGDLFTMLLARENESASLASVEQSIAREQAAADPTSEPIGRLRQALERQRLFSEPSPMPWPALNKLNDGLGEDARLVKLIWQDFSGTIDNEKLDITMRLAKAPDINDREGTVARYQQLAQNVTHAMPDYTVNVSRYPFPALPHEALSNVAADKKMGTEDLSAEFSIRRAAP